MTVTIAVISGYACPTEEPGTDGETFKQLAFDGVENQPDPVLFCIGHDRDNPLATTEDGSLSVREDLPGGLRFEASIPNTPAGRECVALFLSGQVSGASFAFAHAVGGFTTLMGADGRPYRCVKKIDDLADISLVIAPREPHFPQTRATLALKQPGIWPAFRLEDLAQTRTADDYHDAEVAEAKRPAARRTSAPARTTPPRRRFVSVERRRLQMIERDLPPAIKERLAIMRGAKHAHR